MVKFKEILNPTAEFFAFLPADWQSELLPQWDELSQSAQVYGLYKDTDLDKLTTMGIIFKTQLPRLTPFEMAIHNELNGYFYIGYVSTLPEYRGKGYASLWFSGLTSHYPKHNFWLTIEEPALADFYQKNNFEIFNGSWFGDAGGEICLVLKQG
jgi:GNAT superfamily N-acetyltransferase